jgi:hypothetical protein
VLTSLRPRSDSRGVVLEEGHIYRRRWEPKRELGGWARKSSRFRIGFLPEREQHEGNRIGPEPWRTHGALAGKYRRLATTSGDNQGWLSN